ncbi:putative toxin-antitoxin system antitoxin component [compost metagenome]
MIGSERGWSGDDAAVMQLLACSPATSMDAQIRNGLTIRSIDNLANQGVCVVEAGILSARRLNYCRRHDSPLTRNESDRLYRVSKVLLLAVAVLGDQDKALAWLTKPRPAFWGLHALDAVATTPGYEQVSDELERLRSGLFS